MTKLLIKPSSFLSEAVQDRFKSWRVNVDKIPVVDSMTRDEDLMFVRFQPGQDWMLASTKFGGFNLVNVPELTGKEVEFPRTRHSDRLAAIVAGFKSGSVRHFDNSSIDDITAEQFLNVNVMSFKSVGVGDNHHRDYAFLTTDGRVAMCFGLPYRISPIRTVKVGREAGNSSQGTSAISIGYTAGDVVMTLDDLDLALQRKHPTIKLAYSYAPATWSPGTILKTYGYNPVHWLDATLKTDAMTYKLNSSDECIVAKKSDDVPSEAVLRDQGSGLCVYKQSPVIWVKRRSSDTAPLMFLIAEKSSSVVAKLMVGAHVDYLTYRQHYVHNLAKELGFSVPNESGRVTQQPAKSVKSNSGFVCKPVSELQEGDYVDARDFVGHWWPAKVVRCRGSTSFQVHFFGWWTGHDEFLNVTGQRLAVAGTRVNSLERVEMGQVVSYQGNPVEVINRDPPIVRVGDNGIQLNLGELLPYGVVPGAMASPTDKYHWFEDPDIPKLLHLSIRTPSGDLVFHTDGRQTDNWPTVDEVKALMAGDAKVLIAEEAKAVTIEEVKVEQVQTAAATRPDEHWVHCDDNETCQGACGEVAINEEVHVDPVQEAPLAQVTPVEPVAAVATSEPVYTDHDFVHADWIEGLKKGDVVEALFLCDWEICTYIGKTDGRNYRVRHTVAIGTEQRDVRQIRPVGDTYPRGNKLAAGMYVDAFLLSGTWVRASVVADIRVDRSCAYVRNIACSGHLRIAPVGSYTKSTDTVNVDPVQEAPLGQVPPMELYSAKDLFASVGPKGPEPTYLTWEQVVAKIREAKGRQATSVSITEFSPQHCVDLRTAGFRLAGNQLFL